MASYLYGGVAALARRQRAFAFIETDPVFSNKDRIYGDQDHKYMRASEKVCVCVWRRKRRRHHCYHLRRTGLNSIVQSLTTT